MARSQPEGHRENLEKLHVVRTGATMVPKVTIEVGHDLQRDALVVRFEGDGLGPWARTEWLQDLRLVDYDAAGRAISIELLDVSHGVELAGLPYEETVRELLQSLARYEGWTLERRYP